MKEFNFEILEKMPCVMFMIGEHKNNKYLIDKIMSYYNKNKGSNIKESILFDAISNQTIEDKYFKHIIFDGSPNHIFRLTVIDDINLIRIPPDMRLQISCLILLPENNEIKLKKIYNQYIEMLEKEYCYNKTTYGEFINLMKYAYKNNHALLFIFRYKNDYVYYTNLEKECNFSYYEKLLNCPHCNTELNYNDKYIKQQISSNITKCSVGQCSRFRYRIQCLNCYKKFNYKIKKIG